MKILNSSPTEKYLVIFSICSLVLAGPVTASDWWSSLESESQAGFSAFSPPSSFTDYSRDKEKIDWRSGSSFNNTSQIRYVPVVTKRNPWKAATSSNIKKSFSSNRPWGKLPERRPVAVNSMRFHDQRFKRWSHQMESSYHDNFYYARPRASYGLADLPFATNYGFPGSVYNSPLITPALYSGGIVDPLRYGIYPSLYRPYAGFPTRTWGW